MLENKKSRLLVKRRKKAVVVPKAGQRVQIHVVKQRGASVDSPPRSDTMNVFYQWAQNTLTKEEQTKDWPRCCGGHQAGADEATRVVPVQPEAGGDRETLPKKLLQGKGKRERLKMVLWALQSIKNGSKKEIKSLGVSLLVP